MVTVPMAQGGSLCAQARVHLQSGQAVPHAQQESHKRQLADTEAMASGEPFKPSLYSIHPHRDVTRVRLPASQVVCDNAVREPVYQMTSYIAVIVAALVFRSANLGRATPFLGLPIQLICGIWLGMAAWIAGALFHAWTPVWQMAIVGLVLGLLTGLARIKPSANVQSLSDLTAVAMVGLLSAIPVSAGHIAATAIAFAAAGFAIDGFTVRLPQWLKWALMSIPLVPIGILSYKIFDGGVLIPRLRHQDPLFPSRLALVLPHPGSSISLKSGATAWFLDDASGGSRGVAVLLHGNHAAGSRQPAAVALQAALTSAGYDVLSVDHPGYGSSSLPDPNADWTAWDPTVGVLEAVSFAKSAGHIATRDVVLVGHSMGVGVALQSLATTLKVQRVYLFGGSLSNPNWSESYWIRRFHERRSLPCCLPLDKMRKIRAEFYRSNLAAADLPLSHAPVQFVRFDIDHDDVTRNREPLYALIPGQKHTCDLASMTHYFNTVELGPFILADPRAILRTTSLFAEHSSFSRPRSIPTLCQ